MRKKHEKVIKNYSLVTISSILVAVLLLVLVRTYTGYDIFDSTQFQMPASSGSITEVNIDLRMDNPYWQGYFGAVVEDSAFTNIITYPATGSEIDQAIVILECIEDAQPVHELYLSMEHPDNIDWVSVGPGDTTDIDAFLGLPSSSRLSATHTFTTNISIRLGPTDIFNVPATWTWEYNNSNPETRYPIGFLQDSLGNFIFVTNISEYGLSYSPNFIANYQLMVPVPNETTLTYYFYGDPFDDCTNDTGTGTGVDVGPGTDAPGDRTETRTGVGPGRDMGPFLTGPFLEEPIDITALKKIEEDIYVSIDHLNRRLRMGNFLEESFSIYNFKREAVTLDFEIIGDASEVVELQTRSIIVPAGSIEDVYLTIFGIGEVGTYNGSIAITGDALAYLPTEIIIHDEERLPVEALLVTIDALKKEMTPGGLFKYKVDLHNMLTDMEYNVTLEYKITDINLTESFLVDRETVPLKTSFTLLKRFKIPEEMEVGDYILSVKADYLGLTSTATTIFTVTEPFYNYTVVGGLRLKHLFYGLIALAVVALAIYLVRRRMEKLKRFHAKVYYNTLPKKGPRSIYIGKIAETENDTFMDMDQLTVHSIVAGSTGGGKTISAQVIVEECLLKDIAVVVFDPTAQWSGMLRKCEDAKMMSFYPRFHLNKKSSRAFDGNVRAIKDSRQVIDVMNYMKPGEINIFTMSTLDPKDIDIFVANTVREIFHSNLSEYRGLRMLVVYDEVHRLLPRFGGSGEGFIQIERACREFRKWGIGVMLVSQVLADFVGEIKANINTEVQMKTRDEGDLGRIKEKFGGEFVKSLVKSSVGSGMLQNSAYNRGNPYFITFRPIIHSVKRLSDEELAKYNKYNGVIDDLQYQIEQLEELQVDVFDLKLELKLALDKVKTGNFNIVEIYLEGLTPRIKAHWDKMGKTPKKKQLKLVSETELQEELKKAKESRKKYNEEHKEKSEHSGGSSEKKILKFQKRVPFNQALNFSNGASVTTLVELMDVLQSVSMSVFRELVNEEKDMVADWVGSTMGFSGIADAIKDKKGKKEILDILIEEQNKKETITINEESPEEELKEKEGELENEEEDLKEEEKQLKAEEIEIEQEEKQLEAEEKELENEKKEGAYLNLINKTVPKEKYFRLSTGGVIKNIKELKSLLQTMDDSTFNSHVNNDKNDFFMWIKEVYSSDLANEIVQCRTKESLLQFLNNMIKVHTMEELFSGGEDSKEENLAEDKQEIEHEEEELRKKEKLIQQEEEHLKQEEQKTVEEIKKIRLEEYEKFHVSETQYFHLYNGDIIKDPVALKEKLRTMTQDVFINHVNLTKNDFANWIRAVYKDVELADAVSNITDKEEMIQILENYI